MTEVLCVAVDHELVDRVTAIDGHHVVAIDKDTLPEAPADHFDPELILVGSGVSSGRALEYARVMVNDFPEISVVLVSEMDTDLMPQVVSAGIHGVINERISDGDLLALLDRSGHRGLPEAVSRGQQPHPIGELPHQVIVVASPKGGVGKTTTTVNLAALLAESAPGEVVVIDLDLQFGDVATMLDLEPTYTISDAFASGADDSMRLRTLLTPHAANFYVLCGSDDPAENGHVTGDQIRKLVHHYSASFRYVIVDTPAGLLEETLASLEEATDIVLVAALDVATLRAVRREVEVLVDLSLLPPRRHVVLNRANRRAGLSERDVERILGRQVNAAIPVSEAAVLSANRGELVTAKRKRNPVRKAFTQLARQVSDLAGNAKEVDR